MELELKPFNPKRICPKCGSKDCCIFMCDGMVYYLAKHSCLFSHKICEQEHLDVVCKCCQYKWAEECSDAEATRKRELSRIKKNVKAKKQRAKDRETEDWVRNHI